jgi:hypothetical protein
MSDLFESEWVTGTVPDKLVDPTPGVPLSLPDLNKI